MGKGAPGRLPLLIKMVNTTIIFLHDVNIGVAVSKNLPAPFKDALGRPLIRRSMLQWSNDRPHGFVDDDGTAYLYFGQGNCNMVKLADDMVSFDSTKIVSFKPQGYNEGSF